MAAWGGRGDGSTALGGVGWGSTEKQEDEDAGLVENYLRVFLQNNLCVMRVHFLSTISPTSSYLVC
jgi:hypothetical protein